MTYQIVLKKSGVVMVMEDSELRASAGNLFKVLPKYKKDCVQLYSDQIVSLLDKCKDFNVNSQKWSKPPKAHNANGTQDRLKQAIDVTMERLERWSPNNWADLVKELRYEMKVAYAKFINLRKKYSGLIEISRGNQGSELIKAYIARDILDYVKYGINISLQYCTKNIPVFWIMKIATHFEMLARELEGLNVGNEDELRRFADDVSLYKQCMLDFADTSVKWFDESNSKAYMMLRQKGGILFSDLIKEKMNELGFADQFNMLDALQQHEVYQGVINDLGDKNTSKIQFVDFIFGRTD